MARLNPYLSFKDNAREALEHYQSVLGGTLDISTYDAVPGMVTDPGEQQLIMHGQLETPGGLTLMAADTPSMMEYVAPTRGVTVSLTGGPDDMDYIRGVVEKLTDGASDVMPFEKAPWGDYFGQLTDRFGVSWMFDVGTQ